MTNKTCQCAECKAVYAVRKAGQRFCSTPCAKAFNNRRQTRGALLLDLLMTDYVFRDHPRRKSGALQKAARRLLSRWRDEDALAGREHCNDVELILGGDMSLTTEYTYYDGGNPWSGASAALMRDKRKAKAA